METGGGGKEEHWIGTVLQPAYPEQLQWVRMVAVMAFKALSLTSGIVVQTNDSFTGNQSICVRTSTFGACLGDVVGRQAAPAWQHSLAKEAPFQMLRQHQNSLPQDRPANGGASELGLHIACLETRPASQIGSVPECEVYHRTCCFKAVRLYVAT